MGWMQPRFGTYRCSSNLRVASSRGPWAFLFDASKGINLGYDVSLFFLFRLCAEGLRTKPGLLWYENKNARARATTGDWPGRLGW